MSHTEVKAKSGGATKYKVELTDGSDQITGIVSSQLTDLILSKQIDTNSVIRLDDYVCNKDGWVKPIYWLQYILLT